MAARSNSASDHHHHHQPQQHHVQAAAAPPRSSSDPQHLAAATPPSNAHHKHVTAPSSSDHQQDKHVPVSQGYGEAGPLPDKQHLDVKASRLVKAAQRASEAAKRAYTAGLEGTQARAKQVSEVVLENAHRASDSSKAFLSKVASKGGHLADKAHTQASTYKGNVSRAIQLPKDGEGESISFPLSILVWCSTLCGRSKKESKGSHERELAPPETEEEFSTEFLASAADEYATTLEEETTKLQEVVAAQEKKNAPHPNNPKLTPQKSGPS